MLKFLNNLKETWKSITDRTLLKQSIDYGDSLAELRQHIQRKDKRKFKLEWISNTEFKVLSTFSLGTIISKSHPNYFDGIRGFAHLTELSNGTTKIDLKTKFRVELYFFIFLPLLAITTGLLKGDEISFFDLIPAPLGLLWFWIIYRVQEKLLFTKVKNYFLIHSKKK